MPTVRASDSLAIVSVGGLDGVRYRAVHSTGDASTAFRLMSSRGLNKSQEVKVYEHLSTAQLSIEQQDRPWYVRIVLPIYSSGGSLPWSGRILSYRHLNT